MDGFLSLVLDQMNGMSEADLSDLRTGFDDSMRYNRLLFGSHAFRKSLREQSTSARRSVLNIAFFDVMSEYFSDVTGVLDSTLKSRIRRQVVRLLNDDDFSLAITYSTNSTHAVRTRFEMAAEALGAIFS